MEPFAFVTAGESHGPALTVIVDGMPYGFELGRERIDRELARRQAGYGRGARMQIEQDRVSIRGGVRHGLTLGSPIAFDIENRDFANWSETMNPDRVAGDPGSPSDRRELRRPRPGHADLAGCWKLGIRDARPVLERASARETAARVAAGAVARALLEVIGIEVRSHVLAIGTVSSEREDVSWAEIAALPDDSEFRCVDLDLVEAMRREVDRARDGGDTLGGLVEVVAHTPPPGLGHYAQWHQRLDGRLGQALLSIPAVKGVWIGASQSFSGRGSTTHDVIQNTPAGVRRPSNRAGGLEGGMTNGEELRVRIAVKPLSTLRRPLESVDLATGERADAAFERSDVTVVPAAGVVAEAMMALVLARAAREKLGGDSREELCRNLDAYLAAVAGIGGGHAG